MAKTKTESAEAPVAIPAETPEAPPVTEPPVPVEPIAEPPPPTVMLPTSGAPTCSINVWGASKKIHGHHLPGFAAWAKTNAPGLHTSVEWTALYNKYLSTPVGVKK